MLETDSWLAPVFHLGDRLMPYEDVPGAFASCEERGVPSSGVRLG